MADIVTSRLFVDGEKNITAAKLNDIVASSVIEPAFVSAKPSTSTVATTDNLLILTAAGGTYAKAPFQTVIDSVNANLNTNAAIWNVRLRSWNSVGNSTFEVDQRNVGNTVANASGKIIDRWQVAKGGTMAVSAGQQSVAAGINLPGTNFAISRSFHRITLTTAEPTLAAGDYLLFQQNVEGSQFRELQNDVHSLQVLVRSSVANLIIGAVITDPAGTHSLTNTLTLGAANTWVLLALPNLPLWTAAGNFVNTPGSVGYALLFSLACGSTYISPANATWQNGTFYGAVGQSNFAAQAVNSTFDIAFVQHEPGPVCSTPMDCPFTQNLDDCLRYYQKTYDYGTAIGSSNYTGSLSVNAVANGSLIGPFRYFKPMAKAPTIGAYSPGTGTSGSVRDIGASVDRAVSSGYQPVGASGFSGWNFGTVNPAATIYSFHYTADSGW